MVVISVGMPPVSTLPGVMAMMRVPNWPSDGGLNSVMLP